jgi:hypothetical protein
MSSLVYSPSEQPRISPSEQPRTAPRTHPVAPFASFLAMAAERPSLADNPYPPLFLLPPRPRHLIPDVSVALAALASA